MAANFTRKVEIFLSKNGVFVFAALGTRKHREYMKGLSFLPCTSVDTIRDAEDLQVATCKLQYTGDNFIYPMAGTLEGLDQAGADLERLYLHRKSGKSGWPEGWGANAQRAATPVQHKTEKTDANS